MRDTVTELTAISNMLEESIKHGLHVECVWSLISVIGNTEKELTSKDIESACAIALSEWDI